MPIIHIEQQDLRDLSVIRWVNLDLSRPRAVSPFAPCLPAQEWLARGLDNPGGAPFMFWGTWRVDSNSVNLQRDDTYRLGGSAPPENRGWRWSSSGDLEFVERWTMTDGTVQIELAAALYGARFGRVGRFPVPQDDIGRGFCTNNTNLIRRGSFTWAPA